MNSAIQSVNVFSADWAAWLWRVSWQSAIVIAIAWLIVLALRQTSPRVRSWVWRIAYLKILVLTVWTTPLRVAILPPSANDSPAIADRATPQTDGPPLNKAATVVRAKPQTDIASTPFSRDAQAAPAERSRSAEPPAIATVDTNTAEISQSAHPLAWQSCLLFVWLLGLAVVLVLLIREVIGAVQLRRSVKTVQSAELAELLSEVRRQLRVRRAVRLGESPLAGAPLLVKFASPAIVFPDGMLSELDSRELRLALAHELAHLKRHDFAWNALAAIINVLLYFHPLAWLAHRCTRQEQELACDELVITSLGIEREVYGEMLLKIVRRLGRAFPTGMAVVGMASGYQTLSQRIEAIRRFSPLTRRQSILAACAFAPVALLSILPWQVVAQQPATPHENEAAPANESKKSNQPERSPASTIDSATKNTESHSALKALLIGTWTGSYSHDDLTLNKDGTFEHLYEDWGPDISDGGMPSHNIHFQRGRWTISTRHISDKKPGTDSTVNTLELEILHDDTQAPFWLDTNKDDDKPAAEKQGRWYSIERLDKDLMRLKIHDGPEAVVNWISDGNNKVTYQTAPALFYRRVGGTAAPQNYDPKLPESIRRLAVLARLTPDEAKSLFEVINGRPEDSKPTNMHILLKPETIDLIERIDAARHHQINFAQLFDLSTDELTAFRELMHLVDDKYATACLVGDKGNLSSVEDSAMKKLDGLYSQFLNLVSASNDDGTGIGTDKQRDPAVSKLVGYLGDLNEWLNVRIYAVGLPWAGSFGGGGGGGFGGGGF